MIPSTAWSLRARPDWRAAAQHLIDGCAYLPDAATRVELLERLCTALGDELYPALLGVLCTVGERAAPPARRAVAGALVEGLRSGRVPSGRRPAWGASGAASMRSLGPIEYLCAWYAQGGDAQPPSASGFDRAIRALLSLVGASDEARLMYAQHLMAVADDPLSGTLTRSTRDGLRQLASHWEADGADVRAPVDAFLHALQGSGLQALAAPRFTPRP